MLMLFDILYKKVNATDRAASHSFESRHARVRRSLTLKTPWRPAHAVYREHRAGESHRHIGRTTCLHPGASSGAGSDGTGGGIGIAGDCVSIDSSVESLEGDYKPMEGTSVHGWQRQVNATDSSVEKDLRLAG
jgi:hypothetical protein